LFFSFFLFFLFLFLFVGASRVLLQPLGGKSKRCDAILTITAGHFIHCFLSQKFTWSALWKEWLISVGSQGEFRQIFNCGSISPHYRQSNSVPKRERQRKKLSELAAVVATAAAAAASQPKDK
jgi:hypothetical protein